MPIGKAGRRLCSNYPVNGYDVARFAESSPSSADAQFVVYRRDFAR